MKSKMVWTLAIALMIFMSLITFSPIYGGGPSELTAEEWDFVGAVDADYAYEINWIYAYEYGEFDFELGEVWRGAGSDAEHEYARYLKSEMRRIGLQDVTMEPFKVHAYDYGGASVQLVDPLHEEVWLAAGHSGLPGTTESPYADRDGSITAEIVYVGLGTKYDYVDKDVEGKLVLCDVSEWDMYWLQYPHYEAELHGAIGMVVHWVGYQEIEDSVVTHDSECRTTIPAVCISKKNAYYLRDLIESSEDPVEVKIWCDAEIDYRGKSYNVYGYIPGTTHPDDYIIIADHYDKHWYGAIDDGSGVARLLGMAKAFVDSGYQPSRTLVFIATGAEEYGWTDTEFDWAIGAWYAIYEQHPEWVGKTFGYFNLEGGGDARATSVVATGVPETKGFRQSLLPLFDEAFRNLQPNYVHATEYTYSFFSTWADGINPCGAGIPTMTVDSTGEWDWGYHTQYDDMSLVSAESLRLSVVSNGIAIIELDRSVIVPYSFQHRAKDVKDNLETDWPMGVPSQIISDAGVDYDDFMTAIQELRSAGQDVWGLVGQTESFPYADEVNEILLETAKLILSNFTTVGGYVMSMYPYEHYLNDAWNLKRGIKYLEVGNIDWGLEWLSYLYEMWTGRFVSREVYDYMLLDRWNDPTRDDLFWATGRLVTLVDIWDEYDSLYNKAISGDTDYSSEISSLKDKLNNEVLYNLRVSLNGMMTTMSQATDLLYEAKDLLQ